MKFEEEAEGGSFEATDDTTGAVDAPVVEAADGVGADEEAATGVLVG